MRSNCILELDKNTKLEVRVPEEYRFTPDEYEVWLVRENDEKLVHIDTYKYSVLSGFVQDVIEKFKNSDDNYRSFNNFAERFLKYLNDRASNEYGWDYEWDHGLGDHMLFEHGVWYIGLLAEGNDAKIVVCKITHKHHRKYRCREEKSYIVDRKVFDKWVDTLFSLDLKYDII